MTDTAGHNGDRGKGGEPWGDKEVHYTEEHAMVRVRGNKEHGLQGDKEMQVSGGNKGSN